MFSLIHPIMVIEEISITGPAKLVFDGTIKVKV